MYRRATRSIEITVKPMYLEEQSEPASDHYVWAYWVRIENQGPETVQLRARHWRITDASGRLQEDHGEGISGEQPVLEPGKAFEYTSLRPLKTPSGIMAWTYEMDTAATGERFTVEIPPFSLDSPYQERRLH
ncbi:MAG: Co2+/Mg2+ efflux protein ApaG [Alphaproteobacteria bacterium]|nr:Co2+/Mg2+ efflux protein ApaG [Alphaproteobacteria bacterium]